MEAPYLIVSGEGEIYWPKDGDRREIVYSEAEEVLIRQRVLCDAHDLATKGCPFSPAWWRQLGREDMALQVQATLLNATLPPLTDEPPVDPTAKRKKSEADVYEVAEILGERRWKRQRQALVRWAGYHPAWEAWRMPGQGEVGGPLETWEPWMNVEHTEALANWRSRLQ